MDGEVLDEDVQRNGLAGADGENRVGPKGLHSRREARAKVDDANALVY